MENNMENMPLEPSYDTRTCIKVKFFAQISRIYGIMTIVFGENMTYIEGANISLSTYSINYNKVSNNSNFSEFYKVVTDTKDTLESHRKTYFTLKNAVEKDLTFLEKFTKNRNRNIDVMELEADLKEVIRQAINDKKVVIFAAIEKISAELYMQLQLEAEKEKENAVQENYDENEEEETTDEEDFFAIDSTSSIVDCIPVVSPVGGAPVSAIEEGDIIYVTVGSNTIKDKHEDKNTKNDTAKQTRSPAIHAVVQKAAFLEGFHKILVQLDEKTFGKIEEAESVKIKIVKKIQPSDANEETKKSSKGVIVLLIFVIFLLTTATYVLLFLMN